MDESGHESLLKRGKFPRYRARRMRQNANLRRLIRETRPSLDQLVMPYFVRQGKGIREPIESMSGQFCFSTDTLLAELEQLLKAGIRTILLFGLPDHKDEKATGAWSQNGVVQKTLREIKKEFDDILVITDVCLCAYMSHGHCGILTETGEVANDPSLKLLADAAVSHAEAGSDMIAPSDMMDGRIGFLREALDQKKFEHLPILSYAAKYASAFYGPFREAAHSAPTSGDRKSYQMDPANVNEALREIAMDIEEGADIVMVKPALPYLDVLREASRLFKFPLAAYMVSGEYSMIKAAAEKGWLDERQCVQEMLTSVYRAGAQILISYHAKQVALWAAGTDSQGLRTADVAAFF